MIIPLKDGDIEETLNKFFKDILEKKIVDALFIPQSIFSGRSYAYTLVKDPSKIKNVQPFLPILMNNGAKLISSLTFWDPKQKIGAVLRSCEIRGVIELAKFKQITLDRLFLIGVDCLGTMEIEDFEKVLNSKEGFKLEKFLSDLISGAPVNIRKACQICSSPVPQNVLMNLGFIGVDIKKEIFIHTSDELAQELGIEKKSNPDKREEVLSQIVAKKKKQRDQFLAELRKKFKSISDLLNEFARCKRCYNCRVECPICYCKECVFLTNVFEHRPEQYLKWAERKGLIKFPYDTLLFHLTRLNHIAASCISCGQCSSACPNNLPVFELFQLVGNDVQKLFEYEPGNNIDERPPIITFKEELEPL
ncbi:4Fe-4S dicluster domain-containing protein [SCandidatus Aminicenantes bacterium Aminicenantia_JdfR_composite]|jgi:formate dehydrogenase subunit beta|nr:4Fe-4S dicluster domain-containing protein [SCandidatus Aminicenantes bacterium Aminicenantia_JdfR_composite]MCP2596921.1 4Fe-4S dicluster domain-containing protein [Candidatus Aminicenantes bacterium AC-335-G13]MCP2598371.1 4Fe-4S dicluster domain-containing protein [Candidatus Aminicenantes bacterium AC-335-L06]MCP2621170.1 4Fe-4S dicluster domain-containing protein [Candidatus Aminicenantes bacterium AC-334-E05]